jgi:hypothetical protein
MIKKMTDTLPDENPNSSDLNATGHNTYKQNMSTRHVNNA